MVEHKQFVGLALEGLRELTIYSSFNHQKPCGFLMISGGIELNSLKFE